MKKNTRPPRVRYVTTVALERSVTAVASETGATTVADLGFTAMAAVEEWVLLSYRLPREPSAPRVTVWRKLRRLGAVQLVDGLVALPASGQNRERFDWLADEVVEAGGEAWTFDAVPGSKQQQRALAA